MRKLVSIAIGAAILAASAASAQTGTTPNQSGMMSKGDNKTFHHDFKSMDANGDGMISRDEYLRYYGSRFDRMKRNEQGMVMMNDMMVFDGGPATKPGAPNPAGKNRAN